MSPTRKPIRIGVDIGGTFTDLQILDLRDARLVSHKVATTPADPSIGLLDGVREAAQRFGFALDDVGYLLHGTTIATNAVLERKFPRGALVTTAGFEDVLEITRHARREVYSVRPRPFPVLIARDRRVGVAERIRADGRIETALTRAALDALARRLATLDVETVAVSLLNAYVNPAHEHAIRDHLAAALPGVAVSISSAISPEIREYERSSTTVLNALLTPVVKAYLEKLVARMTEARFEPRLLIVQSNGRVCTPETAAQEPVRLLLSGPSGGALAALHLSRALGEPSLVGVDMGGTSYDVSVVREDRIDLVNQGEIDRLPVRVPMVEIRTIGAGGGSIARVDAGRRLAVGPESAGARPGPVCYGHGGTEPTVTDSNLVLGRLDPAFFLGGKMKLDLAGARRALTGRIADALDVGPEQAAGGILTMTNANLAAAIRLSLFEKGLDPRDFALLSFGGAGSLHAIHVAEELGIRRVIFPRDASTLSAWGILHSDIGHDFARSRVMPATAESLPTLAAMAAELTRQGEARLAADAISPADRALRFAADLRYRGQAFELTVPWRFEQLDGAALDGLVADFHAMHRQRFSYANPDDAVEIVTLRLAAIGRLERPPGAAAAVAGSTAAAGMRPVWLDGAWHPVKVLRRDALGPGATVAGPAVIEEDYTTALLIAGWTLRVDPTGHLIATRDLT
ncbi:MAG: hydantoinase/oxoprolinase family protein [Alphaproteobacteria bacterium]|nr:hydantoinase/oxoprolinase family protein [Alphaproteobacteria bacterium]